MNLLIPLALQLAFFVVLLMEMILPSGGLLAILAVGLFSTSWFMVMGTGVTWAPVAFMIADIILIPICIVVGLKLMRRSPLSNRTELDASAGFQVSAGLSPELVGQIAKVVTTLRPSGKVQIGHHVFDALSNSEFIEAGTQVIVHSATENKLIVELLPPEIPAAPQE